MKRIYVKENLSEEKLDSLFIYTILGTMIGARLGHVIFYQFELFEQDFFSVFLPFRFNPTFEFTGFRGLASHGAAIGIITSMYIYNNKVLHKSVLWILDRIVIPVAIGGAFIRIGNFMNSEILGLPTESGNGVVFARNTNDILMYRFDGRVDEINFLKREGNKNENGVPITIRINYKDGLELDEDYENNYYKNDIKSFLIGYENIRNHIYQNPSEDLDYKIFKNGSNYYAEIYTVGIPRHPAQLYEAFYCILLFIGLLSLWYFKRSSINNGFIFSIFMITLWSLRILDELLKENQVDWEADIPLNMGQWLSIPMIMLGIAIFIKTFPKKTSK